MLSCCIATYPPQGKPSRCFCSHTTLGMYGEKRPVLGHFTSQNALWKVQPLRRQAQTGLRYGSVPMQPNSCTVVFLLLHSVHSGRRSNLAAVCLTVDLHVRNPAIALSKSAAARSMLHVLQRTK